MKHIPYVKRDEEDVFDPYMIFERTTAVDYSGTAVLEQRDDLFMEPLPEICVTPPHVFTFATTSGGRNGYFILFDTSRGTVILCDFQVGPKPTALSQLQVNIVLSSLYLEDFPSVTIAYCGSVLTFVKGGQIAREPLERICHLSGV